MHFKLSLFIPQCTHTQTTTIDYLNSGLSTSDCNVFSPASTLNGIQHTSHAGGVTFNTTAGILLSTTPLSSPPGGTAFVINYNFTPGFNFTIAITSVGKPSLLLKTSVVPNFNQFNTNNTSSCTTDPNVFGYQTVGFGQMSTATSTTSATYNVPQFSLPPGTSTHPYLIVWATGGNIALDVLSISQIVITKTAIASFTISPSTVTLSCGTTTAETFTVTNVNNTPNVTNHSWNLGSTSNGWLYNGNPAPQTISTGATNTLTLTPVCGTTPSNINVTVSADGNNYQTNTTAITVDSPPTFSISGDDIVCTSEPYTIPNLPCGATVNWSLSGQPGPLATLSCTSCPQTTVSKGTGSGNEFLTATITVCGVTQTTPAKQIRVGGYTQSSPFNTNGPHVWCKNQVASVSVDQNAYPGLTSLSWGSVPTGWTYITGGGSSNYIVLRATNSTSPPTGTINVTGTDICGNSTTIGHFMAKSNCTSFRISPNPATDLITIEEFDDNTGNLVTESNIKAVEIISRMGVLNFRQQYTAKSIGPRLTLRVGNLRNDIYAVRIFDGLEWKSYKVIISR